MRVWGEEIWFLAQPKIPRELGRLEAREVPMFGALLRDVIGSTSRFQVFDGEGPTVGLKLPTVRDLADVTCNVLRSCFWDSGPEPPNLSPYPQTK